MAKRPSEQSPEEVLTQTTEALRVRLLATLDGLALALPHDAIVVQVDGRAAGWRCGPDGQEWLFAGILADTSAMTMAKVGEALEWLRELAPALAKADAQRLVAAVRLVAPQIRHAVYARLVPVWPWSTFMTFEGVERGFMVLQYLVQMEAATLSVGTDSAVERAMAYSASRPWPLDIAPQAVRDWLEVELNRAKKGVGDRYVARCIALEKRLPPSIPEAMRLIVDGLEFSPEVFVDSHQLAWLASAAQRVELGRREPAFPFPSNSISKEVTNMLASPKRRDRQGSIVLAEPWEGLEQSGGSVRMVWAGKRAPMQLLLVPEENQTLDAAIARSMVNELGTDAFRDWLVIHRMVSEQGGKGDFRWAWPEHRARTAYDHRVQAGNTTEEELARATTDRLWMFKRSELHIEQKLPDGRIAFMRVGPFGLIDIDAGVRTEDRATLVVARGKLNPVIYRGGTTKHSHPHFTLLPEKLLQLPDRELSVAALIAFPWRAADEKGHATIKAKTLWRYAMIPESRWKDKRRWPACRKTGESVLEALAKKLGVQWSGGGDGPEALYTIDAPTWWSERVTGDVGPVLAVPATIGVPRTGTELRSARKHLGLSAAAVAGVLGVSHSTVSRAETTGGPLPNDWVQRLAVAKLRLPA